MDIPSESDDDCSIVSPIQNDPTHLVSPSPTEAESSRQTLTQLDLTEDPPIEVVYLRSPSTSLSNSPVDITPTNVTTELSPSVSNKRKLDDNLEIEPQPKNNKEDEPCTLDEKLGELQSEIKKISETNKYNSPEHLNKLSLLIYLRMPNMYRTLQNCLQLPPVPTLKTIFNSQPLSIDSHTTFWKTFINKVNCMTLLQKHCFVCLTEINVKQNLYYHINLDTLFGIVDINETQRPELAYKALVLSVQGMFSEWKQPISIVYVGAREHTAMTETYRWTTRVNHILQEAGLTIRALVTNTSYNLTKLCIRPQFTKHLYYTYDVSYLFKLFYYTWMTHDISFNGIVAEIQHIKAYYNLDQKRHLRLTPKLSENHFIARDLNEINIEDVKEVISLETAAAMSTYIGFNQLTSSATNTVKLIANMRTLYDILCCNNSDENIKMATGESKNKKQFLLKMIVFCKSIKLLVLNTPYEVSPKGTFVKKIITTIESVLALYKDNESINDAPKFPTQRLSLDTKGSLSDRLQKNTKKSGQPTCIETAMAFRKSALHNILKPLSNDKCMDLNQGICEIKKIMALYKSHQHEADLPIGGNIKMRSSCYNSLNWKGKDPTVFLAGFLLKKCFEQHSECAAMKHYVGNKLQDSSSICKTIMSDIQEGICVVPQESFIEFIEMLEIKFRSFMKKDILETVNNKLISAVLASMQDVNFVMPCRCFPQLYAKKMFLRLRFYYLLKHNNTLIKKGQLGSSLVVPDL